MIFAAELEAGFDAGRERPAGVLGGPGTFEAEGFYDALEIPLVGKIIDIEIGRIGAVDPILGFEVQRRACLVIPIECLLAKNFCFSAVLCG